MRRIITAALLAAGLAAPADAAPSIGESLGTTPLAELVVIDPGTDPSERFLLAGAHFLRATEIVLQARYDAGLTAPIAQLPFLRLPGAPNPDPRPVRDGVIGETLESARAHLRAARSTLDGLPDGAEFKARVRLGDLWFDADADGQRGAGESLPVVALTLTGLPPVPDDTVIAFDNADAAWLDAYASLLIGLTQIVSAYDPDPALTSALEARRAFGGGAADAIVPDGFLDAAAVVIGTLGHQPDQRLTSAARRSLLDAVGSNRRFWELVSAEKDDDAEWIPNPAQNPVIGPPLPEGTRERWGAVLDDAEAVLEGRKLLPFWRSAEGIDAKRLLERPRPVLIHEWVQGQGALPYLKPGEIADMRAIRDFAEMFPGGAGLVAAWLN